MSKARLFFPLTKVDAVQRLVYGRATEEVVDKVKEIFDYASSKPYFEKWSEGIAKASGGKSLGNVRAMHGKVAAGKLTDIVYDDAAKAIDVCSKIVDDQEWAKVEEGVYTGFSVGGDYAKRWDDPDQPGLKRYTADPSEISIVDNPCVPTATFSMVKADGVVEEVAFKLWAPSNDEIAARATALAKAAGEDANLADFMDDARDVLIAEHNLDPEEIAKASPDVGAGDLSGHTDQHADQATTDDETAEAKRAGKQDKAAATSATAEAVEEAVEEAVSVSTETASDADKDGHTSGKDDGGKPGSSSAKAAGADDDWGIDQVFQVRADGKVFAKKADAKAHVDALKTVASDNSPLAEAIKAAMAKAKDGDGPPKPYGDVEYAAPKEGKYPIDTEAHIRAAWSYINQPKNAANVDNPDGVKAKIVAAWKDKIDPDGPPSADKMAALDAPLDVQFGLLKAFADTRAEKGWWNVQDAAGTLGRMASILADVTWEERQEGDDASTLPTQAADIFAALRTFVVDMITEEAAELMNQLGGEAMVNPSFGYSEPVMAYAAKVGDLVKADTGLLEKVGARNSKADMSKLQGMHDAAMALGAKCNKANCPDDEEAEKVAKIEGENAALHKAIDEALPQIAEMGELLKATREELAASQAKIAALEAQPMPMPQPKPITKAGDNGGAGGEVTAESAIAKLIAEEGMEGLQKLAMKLALSRPQRIGQGGAEAA